MECPIDLDEMNGIERVDPRLACPECGQNDADLLVWDADGEAVTCATCGTQYVPGEEPA